MKNFCKAERPVNAKVNRHRVQPLLFIKLIVLTAVNYIKSCCPHADSKSQRKNPCRRKGIGHCNPRAQRRKTKGNAQHKVA